ncbi:toll-like receptor 3 [Osmerus eperlanus]|uniref:toll-like receptor 3 n=1 Tax=Osmerus eperlanus TaxID=29151 RepID=UPI002E10F9A6
MNSPHSIITILAMGFSCLTISSGLGLASPKKTTCHVRHEKADCSRLLLKEIPPDLPRNITSLDMSHNRMVGLSPASLYPYPGLIHLDVGFNSLTRLEAGVCQTLCHLRSLDLQHNEVHLLTEKDLSCCANLTQLNLAWNRLKLQGEPFAALQSLTQLDVSKNGLESAKLGSQHQLPNLVSLILSNNTISILKKDDFSFLSSSSSFRVLDLSHLSLLKMIEPGSLAPIKTIEELIMESKQLTQQLMSQLCMELSGTAIHNLFLQNTGVILTNTTFKALEKTNLTFLDLSHNNLTTLENSPFQWLTKLKTLILEQNNLKNLNKETFQGLGNLTLLNLRRALVKSKKSHTPAIKDFSFQPLGALESLIMENTVFQEITENTFTGLNNLRNLNLGFAICVSLKKINNLTLVSLINSPVQTLNLTGTSINHLGPGAFSSLRNLTSLLLAFNFIAQTLNGTEFQGLDQLQELKLFNNQQKIKLSPTSFTGVPRLKSLFLGKALSSPQDMNPSPFKPLSNLTLLDLSNNNIANINASLLKGLDNLKVLKLQHNNLARVWKAANPGGPVLFLEGLSSLTVLEMDITGLDEIPREGLRGLTNLRELSLSGNVLNYLEDSIFDDLRSLQVLRLQKNLITSVRKEVFSKAFANLSLLVIDTNPFDCTCESILWFVNWLNTTNASVLGRDEYTCNTPSAYFNHSVMKFDPQSCKDMTPFYTLYVLSSTTVLTFMVTAFLFRFHGWRIQFYWNILVNKTLGLSDTKRVKGRNYEYDAYVVYAEADEKWVTTRLLPLEEEEYRFFLENRDSVPGGPRLQSIVDDMKNSQKIIFVVTESLFRDPLCRRFKVHHALHQVIEKGRDRLVLILLQDVQDYRLSQALLLRRGMLRPRCILHWPMEREQIPAFHQKLRIALGIVNRGQKV